MSEDVERRIEVLIEKSIEHTEILIKIRLLLEKIVEDLYGEDPEYVI